MKQLFTFLFMIVLTTSLFAQPRFSIKKFYLDSKVGFFVVDDGAHFEGSFSTGYSINKNWGFGLQYANIIQDRSILQRISMNGIGVETRYSLDRTLMKVAVGHSFNIDGIHQWCVTKHLPKNFSMYVNSYIGYRFSIFTVGLSYYLSRNHSFIITSIPHDPKYSLSGCVIPNIQNENFGTFTLNVGITLPHYKEKK